MRLPLESFDKFNIPYINSLNSFSIIFIKKANSLSFRTVLLLPVLYRLINKTKSPTAGGFHILLLIPIFMFNFTA